MSTIALIGRTPAACSLAVIHAGEDAAVISATAAAYRGHSSSSSIDTAMRSDMDVGSAARLTEDAQTVGSVRRDLEVDDRIAVAKVLDRCDLESAQPYLRGDFFRRS